MERIGATTVKQPYSIENLPPIFIGGAVFNHQYSSDPQALPIKDIVETAFELGLNAIDTSPYYGPSEELLGKALSDIKFSRDQYYICTKAGRVRLDEFDYSRENVRKSVERSLKRLGVEYLDLVYMHDIEFVEPQQIYEALRELKLLKEENVIRNFGISGYPVKLLYEIAYQCARGDIGPLDAILSYSNGCIQNTILFEYYDLFFKDCKIKKLLNGSILSMSLLRSNTTHSFHPGSKKLINKVDEIGANLLHNENIELADLATRFAIKNWLFSTIDQPNQQNLQWNEKTSVVLGVSNVDELKVAIAAYNQVKTNEKGINDKDEIYVAEVQKKLGNHMNETWPSGIYKE
jgi:D-arabinose 1-dehydrogenase